MGTVSCRTGFLSVAHGSTGTARVSVFAWEPKVSLKGTSFRVVVYTDVGCALGGGPARARVAVLTVDDIECELVCRKCDVAGYEG